MKIVIFEVEPWECETFEDLQRDHDVEFVHDPLTSENADKWAEADIVSVFIYSKLGTDTLEKLRNLKLIATRSTGFDHVNVDACRSREIAVANVPLYGENTVAEHVFALLLTISHHMHEAVSRTRQGDFSQTGLQGFDLKGKTLGVLGTGHIGKHVIRIAQGFGMRILAYDAQPDETLKKEPDFAYADFDTVLSSSDIITLHVPSNEKTKHLIGEKEFSKMKKGAVFINTARGSVVETKALIKALSEGQIAAAGLDVLPEEPTIREEAELLRSYFQKKHNLEDLLADHILLHMRNVYITPHSAFNTREAVQRILDTTHKNILAFNKGEPENLVGGTQPAQLSG